MRCLRRLQPLVLAVLPLAACTVGPDFLKPEVAVKLGTVSVLLVLGVANNLYVQIGLVLLIALSAKNAILIVEVARKRYAEGADAVQAAVEAARQRFRPGEPCFDPPHGCKFDPGGNHAHAADRSRPCRRNRRACG